MSRLELKAISEKSVGILDDLGPGIKWLHSYVTDDKVYCVYEARDTEIIKRHAECGGFPVYLRSSNDDRSHHCPGLTWISRQRESGGAGGARR